MNFRFQFPRVSWNWSTATLIYSCLVCFYFISRHRKWGNREAACARSAAYSSVATVYVFGFLENNCVDLWLNHCITDVSLLKGGLSWGIASIGLTVSTLWTFSQWLTSVSSLIYYSCAIPGRWSWWSKKAGWARHGSKPVLASPRLYLDSLPWPFSMLDYNQ